MKYIVIFFLMHFSLVVWGQSSNSMSAPSYGFIENKGQVRDQTNKIVEDVRYILLMSSNNIVLRQFGFSYDTFWDEVDSTTVSIPGRQFHKVGNNVSTKRHYHRVDIDFVNANPQLEIIAEDRASDIINYHNKENRKQTGFVAHHFKKVIYKNLYPFIDLEFLAFSTGSKPVEYNFIVHPGGNVDDIQLKYKGANSMKIRGESIEMKLSHAKLIERIPLSYWKASRKRAKITYKKVEGSGSETILGFKGLSGIVTNELVIDPVPALEWEGKRQLATQVGGLNDLLVSSSGDIYVAGSAGAGSAIATDGSYQTVVSGQRDGLLMRYNASGVLTWSTYYGGTYSEEFYAMVENSVGKVVVTGSSTDPWNACQLITFETTGIPSTVHLYGTTATLPIGLAIDDEDNMYVTGHTSATTGIHSGGGFQSSLNGQSDGFVIKFNSGFGVIWGTYLGGSGWDILIDIEVFSTDDIAVIGYTSSTNSISSNGAFQTTYGGGIYDIVLARFSKQGSRMWSTYLGGSGTEQSLRLAIDNEDSIYFGGITGSGGLATAGSHKELFNGFSEALLCKFGPDGSRDWVTYYPQTNIMDVTIGTNSIFFVGLTENYIDALLAEFSSSGNEVWAMTFDHPATNDTTTTEYYNSIALGSTGIYISGGLVNLAPGFRSDQTVITKFSKPCVSQPISVSIRSTQYSCAMQFAPSRNLGCQINTYAWNFGDGNTATTRNPVHKYLAPGTYTVSLQINYSCGGCAADTTITKQITYSPQPVVLEDTLVEVSTQLKPSVLSASASTFSDTWLLQHEASALADANPFINGSSGVWRNAASFVYNTNRQYSAPLNLATDGTFSLKQFDWETADFEVVPDWIKATSMTEYSPFSYELENKDVLGVYTAALYDYGGHLPSANGVNMRNKEMAFTGFEFVASSSNNTTPGLTGNLLFGSNPTPDYLIYTINSARGNIAVVEAPVSALDVPAKISLSTTGAASSNAEGRNQVFYGNQIICLQAHPTRDDWSVVVFRDASIGLWSGKVRLTLEATPNVVPVFDSVRCAHTGKKSLKIQGANQTYKQPILRLDSAKQYVLSAWVAVAGSQPTTPVLANDLGIVVTIKRRNGTTVSTTVVEPTGPIIEGWQQVKGVFACDINNAQVELTFKTGSQGTAWYDDLRIHPEKGNMKSYVYDLKDYRLRAILDEENFASLFYYDAEGNLYITKKETREGIKTINENISYQVERE